MTTSVDVVIGSSSRLAVDVRAPAPAAPVVDAVAVKPLAAEATVPPGDKINESGNIDCSTTGVKTFTLPAILPAGTYYCGVQNVGTVGIPVRAVSGGNPYHPGSVNPTGTGATMHQGYIANGQGTSMPAIFPAPTDWLGISMLMQGG